MTVTDVSRLTTREDAAEEARLRRELAAVYRLIAHFRMTDLIYNHISVRLALADVVTNQDLDESLTRIAKLIADRA